MGEPGSRYCPRINVLSLREQAMAREQAASSSSIIHGPWGDVVGATPAIRGFACWRRAQSTVKKLAIRIRYFVPAQSTGFHVVQSQLQSQPQVGNRPPPARLRQVLTMLHGASLDEDLPHAGRPMRRRTDILLMARMTSRFPEPQKVLAQNSNSYFALCIHRGLRAKTAGLCQ